MPNQNLHDLVASALFAILPEHRVINHECEKHTIPQAIGPITSASGVISLGMMALLATRAI
jgi:hypothetical protein